MQKLWRMSFFDYSKMRVDKLIEAMDDIFEGLFLTLNR